MPEATRTTRPVVVRCLFCGKANRVDLTRLSAGPKCAACARPILLDRPLKVSEADFESTLQGSSVPVLVDFYADWCGPCKIMAPSVDKLALTYVGKALIAKLDTDQAQQSAGRFNIRGIPTTMVFQKGKEVARQTGAVPYQQLELLLARALGPGA